MSNWTSLVNYNHLNLLTVSQNPGIYAIYDANNTIIYIGKTDESLRNRLTQHLDFTNEPNKRLVNFLNIGGCRLSWMELTTSVERNEWEKALIQKYHPICNVQNNPINYRD